MILLGSDDNLRAALSQRLRAQISHYEKNISKHSLLLKRIINSTEGKTAAGGCG